MVVDNRAGVGLATRRLVQGWRADGLLDGAAVTMMTRALGKSRHGSPSGWVFDLAELLGASLERSLLAGSVAELFHGAVDLIDDIQDGDAALWLSDLPLPLQVNTAFHLVSAASMAAERLDAPLVGALHVSFCTMLTGQLRELSRRDWTLRAYVDVSHRIAGGQIALYLRAASAASRQSPDTLLAVAEPLALLMMIRHDRLSADARLTCFDPSEVDESRISAVEALRHACERIPPSARAIIEAMAAAD